MGRVVGYAKGLLQFWAITRNSKTQNMLRIQDLCKSYGGQVLFDKASLQLTPGERLGLMGRNGHGKSTLFRLILGEEQEDSGIISKPKHYRMGHLAQHLHFTQPTILEEGCLGLRPEEEHDHYKVERILFGLGFTEADLQKAPAEFSGGFQIRLNLAKVLVSNPNLLLLDEPTNYLDIVSIRWIIQFLRSWENELIIISHDREFMDAVTTHTALIHRQKIRRIQGNSRALYTLVAQDEETYEKTRLNEEKQRKHAEAFINRFKAQANRATLVQSRMRMLEKMPKLDKLSQIQNLDFQFHYAPFQAKTLMEVSDLTFSFQPEIPLISNFNLTIHANDRIAVIGKNGKGKSTLLNLLAQELSPQAGTLRHHPNMQVGYFGQTNIMRLNPKLTVETEIANANSKLDRTTIRNICGLMMFSGDHAEKKVSHLSGGEKSRVLLGKILAAPANLLFLDEPTNHLDMQSIEALMESIQSFEGAAVIVTHSEEILRKIATKLVVFHQGKVKLFLGTYDEFLEKVGWDETSADELKATPMVQPEASGLPLNKKAARKKRADIITKRSHILDPLKKEMQTLEKEICDLEETVGLANGELLKASQTQNREAFIALSKKLKDSQKQIDEKFDRLEKISQKHHEQSHKYEALLKECSEDL